MEIVESNQGKDILSLCHCKTKVLIVSFIIHYQLSQSQFERLTAERLDAESKRLRDDVGTRVTSSRREV